MTKEQAKVKIQQLIDRYNSLTDQEKKMNEETTKAKFIRPLFESLGWNFEEDVLLEDKISNGRVDYNFQLDGKTKFFLEAKPLKADVDNPEYAKQATNYAWLKNVKWAVLTDFEGIRIFYPAERGQAKSCLRLDFANYISSFNDLWILSKESFKSDLIDKEAVKWGAKPEEIKVGEQLAEDMNTWRTNLYEHFKTWNQKLSDKILDEGVQKILDRFIFIRSCEDRGLENDTLRSQYRIWEEKGRKGNFLNSLKPLFKEYQVNYNSGLFDEHPVMDWEISSECFDEIINGLYRSKNGQEYDFSVIDADVLGGVYEQYLGHLLKKSDDNDIAKKKRKSQGIYYTPTFIVDYIVQNTLGKVLQEKIPEEIANLKILDPACGSGSFLIKAFDYLVNYETLKENQEKIDLKSKLGQLQKRFQKRDGLKEPTTADKLDILRNNIYGVDLDEQAIEIAQLNLLLKTLDRKQKLPHLDNIRPGNSLIDDSKIAGEKAFNWSQEFPEIMKSGGFDIVIGNPPYVRADVDNAEYQKQRKWMEQSDKYETLWERWDLFIAFIEKGLNLLKENGYLSFIVSESLATSKYGQKLLKWIQENFYVISLDYFENSVVFENVGVVPVIITIQKTKNRGITKKVIRKGNFDNFSEEKIKAEDFIKIGIEGFRKRNEKLELKNTIKLGDICYLSYGLRPNSDERFWKGEFTKDDLISNIEDKEHSKTYLEGKNINKYSIAMINWLEWDTDRSPKKLVRKTFPELYEGPKIFQGRVTGAVYDDTGIICNDSIVVIKRFCDLHQVDNRSIENSISKFTNNKRSDLEEKSKNFDLKFILSILNSNFANKFLNGIRRHRLENYFYPEDFRNLPIPNVPINQQKEFVKLADKMLKLNKELQTISKGANRWNQLKSEVERTDKLIDQKVYELYGSGKKR